MIDDSDIELIPGSYVINIPKEIFYDDNNNLTPEFDSSINFTVNILQPIIDDLDSITNENLINRIDLSDKILSPPFEYNNITTVVSTNSIYIDTIEPITNGIIITFNNNIKTGPDSSFNISLDFSIDILNSHYDISNVILNVLNENYGSIIINEPINNNIVKQTDDYISFQIDHNGLDVNDISYSVNVLDTTYIGIINPILHNIDISTSNLNVNFNVDETNYSNSITLDINVFSLTTDSDSSLNQIININVPTIAYVNINKYSDIANNSSVYYSSDNNNYIIDTWVDDEFNNLDPPAPKIIITDISSNYKVFMDCSGQTWNNINENYDDISLNFELIKITGEINGKIETYVELFNSGNLQNEWSHTFYWVQEEIDNGGNVFGKYKNVSLIIKDDNNNIILSTRQINTIYLRKT